MARKPGIGLIAPSGQVTNTDALDQAIAYFRACGWRVVAPAAVKRVHQRFAGTDAARVAALHAMAARDDVDIVMAVRGSYGLSRLLGQIDYALLAKSRKCFIGHSDFTALLSAAHASAGVAGWSGPMACADFHDPISTFTERHFWQMVEHGKDRIEVDGGGSGAFHASGTLWGGNLAMLASLVGTPYLPNPSQVRGGILYVEDINEHPFRVERMLLQLHHAGLLKQQKALLLGDFSAYKLAPNDNGYDFATMVAYLRATLGIPVFTGLPFGHVRDKLTLPFGGKAVLEAGREGWQLEYSA